MTEPTSARPPIGARVIAVLLIALGLNALVQAPNFLPGWGDDPALLSLQQALCAGAGLSAGVGAWRGRTWAWIATLAYGVLTGVMLITLVPLLDLDPTAQKGIWSGAAIVLAVCGGFAWYLRRAIPDSAP